MKITIASEKERIIKNVEACHRMFDDAEKPEWKISQRSDEIKELKISLDHIASVARQEGREEILSIIRYAVDKVMQMDVDNGFEKVKGYDLNGGTFSYLFFKELAKLTGKEEGK